MLHRMPEHVRTVCLEFFGNDLARADPLPTVEDPYTGASVPVERAMHPDVALIHAQAADDDGNLFMLGNLDILTRELGEQLEPVRDEVELVIDQIYRIQDIIDKLLKYGLEISPIHEVMIDKALGKANCCDSCLFGTIF